MISTLSLVPAARIPVSHLLRSLEEQKLTLLFELGSSKSSNLLDLPNYTSDAANAQY